MKLLRTYIHRARVTHFCSCCNCDIQEGQIYEGRVYVTERYLIVVKKHHDPGCEFPDDPEYNEGFGVVSVPMLKAA